MSTLKKIPCPVCGSSKTPALQPYPDGNGYCFACNTAFSDPYNGVVMEKGSFNNARREFEDMENSNDEWDTPAKPIELGDVRNPDKEYRGLRASVLKKFGVKVEGDLDKVYYPYTKNMEEISGYKIREVDSKMFRSTGELSGADLFGIGQCSSESKRNIIIHEGENDCMATWQLLQDRGKGQDCVACSGANGRNIKTNWEFLDQYDNILILFDSDKPGQAAAKKIAPMFAPGKVRIVTLPEGYKDSHELLEDTKVDGAGLLAKALRTATEQRPDGIVSVDDLFEEALKAPDQGIPYPWPQVTEMTGGIRKGEIVVVTAGSGCVSAETEFLTPTGWKRIDEFVEGDQVAQISGRDQMEFVYPSHYHKVPSKGFWSIDTRIGLSMDLSPEHNVVSYYGGPRRDLKERTSTAQAFVEKHSRNTQGINETILTSFVTKGGGNSGYSEAYLRLKVAAFADGTFPRGRKGSRCLVQVSKERKIQRMKYLLEAAEVPFKILYSGEYHIFSFLLDNEDKTFPKSWYALSSTELRIIADEVFKWDGTESRKTYYTSIKSDADFIQYVFSTMGFRASLSTDNRKGQKRSEKDPLYKTSTYYKSNRYTVRAIDQNFVGLGGTNPARFKWKESADNLQYCFTVPSGKLVLRCRDRVFITGNSGKTVFGREMLHHLVMKEDKKVGFFFLEERSTKTLRTLAGMESGVQYHKMHEIEDVAQFREDMGKFRDKAFFYDSFGSNNWETIQAKIRYMASALEVEYIVLDNLTALTAEESDEYGSLNMIMSGLAGLCIELDIHIQVISHLRKSQGGKAFEEGAQVSSADLRGSSSINFWCFQAIAVERNTQHEDEDIRNTSTLRMLKDRVDGRVGETARLFYQKETGRWIEAEAVPEEDF